MKKIKIIKALEKRIEEMSRQIYCNYFSNKKVLEENAELIQKNEALLKENSELLKIIELLENKKYNIPEEYLHYNHKPDDIPIGYMVSNKNNLNTKDKTFTFPRLPNNYEIKDIKEISTDDPNIQQFKIKVSTNGAFDEVKL